jgi:AcrR family transcriptional regulator
MEPSSKTDGRRERGDRTRRQVVERAAALASESGLSGVSIGDVARDLGLSKSGVAAAFGTREDLELATVVAARGIFDEEVVAPAMARRPGRPRLRALVASWLDYVERRVFPGGCFMAAVLPEYDTKPGVVQDALREAHAAWLQLLADQIVEMQRDGDLDDDLASDLLAFEVDAILAAANLERNLTDETDALTRVERLLRARFNL